MKRSHSRINERSTSQCAQHDDHEDKLFSFVPPLHIQRKRKVLDNVINFIKRNYLENTSDTSNFKIIDVGCERGAFFQYFQTELIGLKNKFDTKYFGIDISEFTLSNETVENLNRFPMGNSSEIRNGSVSVKLLHENILSPSFYLDRPDVLVMIEVIEHIPLKEVNKRLPHSIFGEICPKVVIITTPNADFNEIFGLKSRLQFRHWDHKYEWTRNEFKCWCDNVTKLYPEYVFKIDDIGTSDQFPLHGGGSQMAVFIRTLPQLNIMNSNLSLKSSIVYEKENLFSALSEYDVIKNFILCKMSLWAVEKHVSIIDTFSSINNENDPSLSENQDNLGIIEYDDNTGREIFKISSDVVEQIVKLQYSNTDIDICTLLEECSNYSIYFKLSDDKSYIYYMTEMEEEIDNEEDYMKKYSNLYDNVQCLCGRIEDVDLTEF